MVLVLAGCEEAGETGQASYTIAVDGSAVSLTGTPSLSFGNIVRDESGSKTIAVTNTGDAALEISSLNITTSLSDGSSTVTNPTSGSNEFKWTQTPNLTALDPGSTREFILTILNGNNSSSADWTATGTLTIASNAENQGAVDIGLSATLLY